MKGKGGGRERGRGREGQGKGASGGRPPFRKFLDPPLPSLYGPRAGLVSYATNHHNVVVGLFVELGVPASGETPIS